MVKVLPKITSIILFFILLSHAAYAINLGGVVKNSFSEISADESVKLAMLFWNSEEDSYNIKLSVKESPKNWIVIISPDEFVLNKFIGEEYISLPYNNEFIKAKLVNVFVKANQNSSSGNYSIVIRAETELSDNNNFINVVPERLFEFKFHMNGLETIDNDDEISISALNLKLEEIKSENLESKQSEKNIFYAVIMFIALLSLILFYKKI